MGKKVKVVSYVLGSVWENTGGQLTGTLLRTMNIFVGFFSKKSFSFFFFLTQEHKKNESRTVIRQNKIKASKLSLLKLLEAKIKSESSQRLRDFFFF